MENKKIEKLTFMKRADKLRNRIIIPKCIINKVGRDFYLEYNVKDETIKLIPIKKEN